MLYDITGNNNYSVVQCCSLCVVLKVCFSCISWLDN